MTTLRSVWRYGQCWTQTKKKTTAGVRAEESGSLTREQSNSGRKYDSKLHNAVKRGLSRTYTVVETSIYTAAYG